MALKLQRNFSVVADTPWTHVLLRGFSARPPDHLLGIFHHLNLNWKILLGIKLFFASSSSGLTTDFLLKNYCLYDSLGGSQCIIWSKITSLLNGTQIIFKIISLMSIRICVHIFEAFSKSVIWDPKTTLETKWEYRLLLPPPKILRDYFRAINSQAIVWMVFY